MICHKVFEILEDSSSSVKYMRLSMELGKTLGDY